MANKYLNQFQLTYERDTVTIYGTINIGASGAVSSFAGGGVSNVVKESTDGQYTISFSNEFSRFLFLRTQVVSLTPGAVVAIQLLEDPSTMQADIKADQAVVIQCLDSSAMAANPAEGDQIEFVAIFRNSSIGPFDA